jgi:hypothetical protein
VTTKRGESLLANAIGYVLGVRGYKVERDDAIAAAKHVMSQGWSLDGNDQLTRLALFIMEQIPGEPSQPGEGAVDCAIRLLQPLAAEGGNDATP